MSAAPALDLAPPRTDRQESAITRFRRLPLVRSEATVDRVWDAVNRQHRWRSWYRSSGGQFGLGALLETRRRAKPAEYVCACRTSDGQGILIRVARRWCTAAARTGSTAAEPHSWSECQWDEYGCLAVAGRPNEEE